MSKFDCRLFHEMEEAEKCVKLENELKAAGSCNII